MVLQKLLETKMNFSLNIITKMLYYFDCFQYFKNNFAIILENELSKVANRK